MDSVVLPEFRSQGVGGKLIDARYNLIRKLNLRGLVAGSLPIDYYKVAASMPIEQYVQEVVAGLRFDTNLSKQLRKGFQVHGLIPNYTIEPTCCGWGVEIVWDNPDYQPLRRVLPATAPTRRPSPAQGYAPLMVPRYA
ncbi:MAG: hypothetical protein J0L63_15195 [Anaerolineae bacterium]|nr:hypothetical protein [Anaerolineae bacterium]